MTVEIAGLKIEIDGDYVTVSAKQTQNGNYIELSKRHMIDSSGGVIEHLGADFILNAFMNPEPCKLKP